MTTQNVCTYTSSYARKNNCRTVDGWIVPVIVHPLFNCRCEKFSLDKLQRILQASRNSMLVDLTYFNVLYKYDFMRWACFLYIAYTSTWHFLPADRIKSAMNPWKAACSCSKQMSFLIVSQTSRTDVDFPCLPSATRSKMLHTFMREGGRHVHVKVMMIMHRHEDFRDLRWCGRTWTWLNQTAREVLPAVDC